MSMTTKSEVEKLRKCLKDKDSRISRLEERALEMRNGTVMVWTILGTVIVVSLMILSHVIIFFEVPKPHDYFGVSVCIIFSIVIIFFMLLYVASEYDRKV